MVYYIPKLEKDTSIKTWYWNTLSNPWTVSLNNNVTLSNLTQKNTNTTTNKPNYYVLKWMQNGTINKNNLMSYMTPAQNTQYTVKPNITEMLENSYDYLEQRYKQSNDYRLVQQDKRFVDKHPQAMTEEWWIDRQRALNAWNTELAKQIEEQDKAKRVQNWNNWWNSEAEVKKRQERTDKYNKEQEKKQKEYDARIPESIKKIQKFADETKNDIAMQWAREYVKELTQTMWENEIADYLDNYLYIQWFASWTKSWWWSDYSAYNDLKEDLKALIEENWWVVDIENASKLAKYIKDATWYELPADWVWETLWRWAKSLWKNTAKWITKVWDSIATWWSMASTWAKNAITWSNDKYRQYNSWDDLNAELNWEVYRKEYKDPSLQNAWSNALSGWAWLAQVAQTVYFPVINYVFDTAWETQVWRDLFSNKYAWTAIWAVIWAVATKWKWTWIWAWAWIWSVPTLVDKAVEEYAWNMSEEDKENLKWLITDWFFTALWVKQTWNNYKPIQSKVQTVKNTAEAIKNVPKTVETIKDSRAVKQATKWTEQATVSKEYDPTRVANANKNIDTRRIKTYEQWWNALKDRVTKASREVDSMLSKDKVYDLKDFNQKTTSWKTEVNYVKNALEDMKKFYEKNRSYEKLEKIEDILSWKEKLSELDVNNLAREYWIEFDAWLKNWELSSSANKQWYETTRMWIKQWLRENTEWWKKAETLDREISDIKNLEKIVDRRTKNVTSEEIRGKESVLWKVVRWATTVAWTAVWTALAPWYWSIWWVIVWKVIGNILTNVWKKQWKSDLDMQKSLNKNLKKIQKLSERLKKKEITEKQVEREIEDLLSSEKQRSKFLKKKTKTEAKKLSEPKVKWLLTEWKKTLPEWKKLLKSGEKTENKAKTEAKPLKKSEKKVEKKTEEKSNYTEVQNKIDEISKEIKNDLNKKQETEYNELYKRFDELRNKKNKTEAEWKELVNLQTKLNNLSNKYTKLHEEELKVKAKDLIDLRDELWNKRIKAIRESIFKQEYDEQIQRFNEAVKKANDDLLRTTKKELEKIIEETKWFNAYNDRVWKTERANRIAQWQYEELKKEFDRRWLDFIDEFSNLLKKPKKLEAKKLEKPKKESEVKNKWDELRETQSKLNQATYILEKYKSNENLDFNMIEKIDAFYDILHNTKMDNRYIDGKKTSDAEIYKEIAKVYNETNGNYEKINPKDRLEILEDILEKEIEHYEYKKNKEVSEKDFPDLMELIEDAKKDIKTLEEAKKEVKPLKKETKPLKKVEEVKVEEKIETLPKDVSIESEAKQMWNKRIAPDRVKWQQLKYEDWVSNMQDSVNKLANYLQSKKRTVEAIWWWIDSYLRLMPTWRYNSVSWFLEKIWFKSKQGKEFKTLVQNIVEADWNKTILNEIWKHLYITRVKWDISKWYQYPQEVVDKIPWAKKAINDRERYQKWLDTSFSAKDARIDYSDVDKIWAWIKSQDGKQITKEQRENIVKWIQDFEKVFWVDLKQLAKDEWIVYVDLHWWNPFLNKAWWQYTTLTNADWTVNKSVSVWWSEIYRYKDANWEWQTEKVNTTMAHELTHFLDLYSEKRLLTDKEVSELRKTMIKDWKTWGKWKSYWNDSAEITARAFEEYFGMKKWWEWGTRGKGVKFTEHWYYWNEKNFKEIVEPIVEKAVKNFKDRMEVKIEDLPF